VEKDDAVSILYSSKRFSIAIPAIAREPGAIGDRIWVRNMNSNKLIRAQIREKGIVTVIQGELSI
jgi:flagella basal body P-ring formation protein FlgA